MAKVSPPHKSFAFLRTPVRAILGGLNVCFYLLEDGRVFSLGSNENLRAGQPDEGSFSTRPQLIADLPPIAQLCTSSHHSLALATDGRVYSWGLNDYGQAGRGFRESPVGPGVIPFLPPLASISGSRKYSAGLTDDGRLFHWGRLFTEEPEPPIPYEFLETKERFRTTSCGGEFIVRLGEDGRLSVIGKFSFDLDLAGIGSVQDVAAGDGFFLALDEEGKVWSAGDSRNAVLGRHNYKEMGLGKVEGLPRCRAIGCSGWSAFALDVRGDVWGWGYNGGGFLGILSEEPDVGRATRLTEENSRVRRGFLPQNGCILPGNEQLQAAVRTWAAASLSL